VSILKQRSKSCKLEERYLSNRLLAAAINSDSLEPVVKKKCQPLYVDENNAAIVVIYN